MAGQVNFQITAEEGQAVNAFLRLVDAQKKAEAGMSNVAKAGRSMNGIFGGIASSAAGMLGGLASWSAIQGMATGLVANLTEMSVASLGFARDMKPLMALGSNLGNIGGMRTQVLDLSTAWGIGRTEMAAAMFDLQSGTANLSKTTRDELMQSSLKFTQLVGGDLPTNLKMLVKTYQVYREELGSVSKASDKLLLLGEQGYLTFAEMATMLPDVMPAAKAMGFSFDDIAGALITATQYGGKSEKTFTGLRNIFLKLSEAQKEGVHLTGTFVEQLEQLGRVDPEVIKKIFGVENISVAAILAERSGEVRANVEAMANAPGGAVDRKTGQMLADPTSAMAAMTATSEQFQKNAIVGALGESPELRKIKFGAERWKRTREMAREVHPIAGNIPGFGALTTVSGDVRELADEAYLAQLRKGGQNQLADYVELASGRIQYSQEELGYQGAFAGEAMIPTGQDEAERFMRERGQNPNLNLETFRRGLVNEGRGKRGLAPAYDTSPERMQADATTAALREAAVAQRESARAQLTAAQNARSRNVHTE